MIQKHICILPGDGIGREVTTWGKRVLQTIGKLYGHTFTFSEALIGHTAIEKTGTPLPDATLEVCINADAILLGAVGHPMYDEDPTRSVRPEQGLLKLRKTLGLYANIRPIMIFEELQAASSLKPEVIKEVDILFFRELTGGIYFGKPRHRSTDRTEAIDTMAYSKAEVERIAHKAFQAAQRRRQRVHSVDKANVLETSRLWRETVQEVAKSYPDVTLYHQYIDNAAMQLIRDPRQFDVVLTGNMFGDILTDAASQIAGSLGMLPSASVGNQVGLYEPIHGSAPDIAGQNIANPMAAILSVALLLEMEFGLSHESKTIIQAIEKVLQDGFRTRDTAEPDTDPEQILGTDQIGHKIIESITVAAAQPTL